MTHSTTLAGRSFRLKLRSLWAGLGRGARRRGKPAFRFTAEVAPLEERRLMSRGLRLHAHAHAHDAPLEMPRAPSSTYGTYNTVASPSGVLTYGSVVMKVNGVDTTFPIPTKQITIHNNTKQTIYPFLYDANTGQASENHKITGSWLDPFDKHNEEYRAYIGYQVGTTDYLGLEKNQSITIDVPLVFWDGGRIAFATSSHHFLPAEQNGSGINPFQFYYYNPGGTNPSPSSRYVVPAVSSSQNNGIVMYYHRSGLANGPADDATHGYGEFTYRDQNFLTAVSKYYIPSNPLPKDYLNTSVNYDVSYVDSFLLPIAMEATKVPVPNNPGVAADYGWIGAPNSFREGVGNVQESIRKFTSNGDSNGLGTYFQAHGKNLGWPTYYNPTSGTDPNVGTMVPSGYDLFSNSPLGNVLSAYDNNRFMLSSAGNGPVKLASNATAVGPDSLKINDFVGMSLEEGFKTLKIGMTVMNGLTSLGTIKSLEPKTYTVTVSATGLSGNYSPDFVYPVSDPYVTKLTNLWYSWSSYYLNLPKIKHFPKVDLTATVSNDTDNNGNDPRILTFSGTAPNLPLGTQVTVTANKSPQPLITIMKKVVKNGVTYYYLSQPLPSAGSQTLTFSKPRPISYVAQTQPIHINFEKDSAEMQRFARKFAATTYESLSVYSTAFNNGTIRIPMPAWIVSQTIGGNVGYLPTANPINYVNISADARDLAKSALRGVPNFNNYPEKDWYPAPSHGTGNQTYNVFNLDPYVWWVHKELKLTGYGFSFDDDTADVNANGSTTLSIAVGGLDHLTNKDHFAASAPYGTVHCPATIDKNNTSIISLASKVVYNQVLADDKANGVVGAFVSGQGIAKGTRLAATAIIDQNQFKLSHPADPSMAGKTVELTFFGRLAI